MRRIPEATLTAETEREYCLKQRQNPSTRKTSASDRGRHSPVATGSLTVMSKHRTRWGHSRLLVTSRNKGDVVVGRRRVSHPTGIIAAFRRQCRQGPSMDLRWNARACLADKGNAQLWVNHDRPRAGAAACAGIIRVSSHNRFQIRDWSGAKKNGAIVSCRRVRLIASYPGNTDPNASISFMSHV